MSLFDPPIAPASRPTAPPRAALLIRPDTMGDLVLFAPTLRCLRAAWPQTRLAVVIRRPFTELARLLVPGVEWIATEIDPFVQGPGDAAAELARLRRACGELPIDLVVGACPRRNWLEAALGAAAPGARRVGFGSAEPDPFFATQLRFQLGLVSSEVFPEIAGFAAGTHDWERNFGLAEHLLGRPVAPEPPVLELDADTLRAADAVLGAAGLEPGRFAACAAAGFANVPIKTWPGERYAAALAWLRSEHQLPALLVGHRAEREVLAGIQAAAGTPGPALWLGGEGELPLLAGLLARSTLYFGNDTGAMHLAAALGRPVVAVFGGGTWPRFQPAARQAISLVNPLPCFGCGWDCPFGDAPCVKAVGLPEVRDALTDALRRGQAPCGEIRELRTVPEAVADFMGRTAALARTLAAGHLARQHKLEETVFLAGEKDGEIVALKNSANEKDGEIGRLKAFADEKDAEIRMLKRETDLKDAEIQMLSAACRERLQVMRDFEKIIQDLRAAAAAPGPGALDVNRHYQRQLRDKEDVLQALHRACQERDALILRLAAESTGPTAGLRKLSLALAGWWRARLGTPVREWLYRRLLDGYWMRLGTLRQYAPRPLRWEARPVRRGLPAAAPRIALVTPSYNQGAFLERTLESVLGQDYPRLLYAVQDGASTDDSLAIIQRHAGRLHSWASAPDAGQADAINRGFARLTGDLAADDVMAYLNSDDLLAPGALRRVGRFFAAHPRVDVIYGHRIVIDAEDREIGRWVLPRHDPETLRWIDFVPQETIFWRKRAWDLVGGLDPSFQFALDWDLLLRLQQAGLGIERLPHFLGAFRVHGGQKTSAQIDTRGQEEMARVRAGLHGPSPDPARLDAVVRRAQFRGAVAARLLGLGLGR